MEELISEKYKFLIPLLKGIAQTLGSNCEVVLHDLNQLENSIVAIENGHVTGRKVGDPTTNLALEVLREGAEKNEDMLNYMSTTKDGKMLKSSSIYIRDDEGKAIGSICINYNITDFVMVSNIINDFVSTENNVKETFSKDINDVLEALLEEAMEIVGKPVPFMNKEDKLLALEFLDKKGVFMIKRSIERVAQFLDVSKFTIYNYLEEIRVKDKNMQF